MKNLLTIAFILTAFISNVSKLISKDIMKLKFTFAIISCLLVFNHPIFSQKAKKPSVSTSTPKKISIPKKTDTFFWWQNGMNEIVKVDFLDGLNGAFADSTRQTIIITVMVKSEAKIKNKLSAIPKKLILFKVDDSEYGASTLYYAQNDFGVLKELNTYFRYNSKGVFIED